MTTTRLHALIAESTLKKRIAGLAADIDEAFGGRHPLLLGVMKGSIHFLSDLSRALQTEHDIDFVRVSNYPTGETPSGEGTVETWEGFTVEGRDVLVVDDILDRGHTAEAIEAFLISQGAASVGWVFLLVKAGADERTRIKSDHVGFEIPDLWVVGYGLDLNERFRGLPSVYSIAKSDE